MIKQTKKLKLDGETKNFFKEIENQEKGIDKKGFMKYFGDEPTALLRKSLDEIKQQTIELNEDERNSTNNKNKNYRLNTILSVIDRIYQFFEYKCLSDKQPDESKLPKWVKVTKQRFDVIKKKVQNAKNNNW